MDIQKYFEEGTQAERLLLVEGRDDDDFCQAICVKEGLQHEIEILFYREHGELSRALDVLVRQPGFERVRAIGLTRDSDNGAEAAHQSLRSAWGKAARTLDSIGKPAPAVFFFAVPNNTTKGRIEDLCLGSAALPAVLACAEQMRDCVLRTAAYEMDREKSLVCAYLAMMERPGLRLGVGALQHYWNLDSEIIRPLRQFIREIAGR